MPLTAIQFYTDLAAALRNELPGNTAVRVAERLANVFEKADTPETFNRTEWINLVRNG